MERHALERLGHYIVSRRLALGYRNRTDLANSLQFTVRTLADIEHGVRKASPGTYAMLENTLAWAPGSIDTILAGGEPNELVVKLRRGAPDRLSHAATDALSRASTEELLLELRRRIITPAKHVKCGKTGAAFTLAATTGPKKATPRPGLRPAAVALRAAQNDGLPRGREPSSGSLASSSAMASPYGLAWRRGICVGHHRCSTISSARRERPLSTWTRICAGNPVPLKPSRLRVPDHQQIVGSRSSSG